MSTQGNMLFGIEEWKDTSICSSVNQTNLFSHVFYLLVCLLSESACFWLFLGQSRRISRNVVYAEGGGLLQ